MILLCFLTTVSDILAVEFDVFRLDNMFLRYLSHSLYLVFHCLTPVVFVMYITLLTDSRIRGKMVGLRRAIHLLPLTLAVVAIILNKYNHKIFYIDGNGDYQRGSLIFVLYIISFAYIAFGYIKLLIYRHSLEKNRKISLVVFLIFTIIAVALQFICPHLLVEMFSHALGLLFILLMVQKPEELYDSRTGLLKFEAFVRVIRRCFANNTEKNIILINITNYFALRDMLEYKKTVKILQVLSNHIKQIISNSKVNGDIYHLDNGQFAVILYEESDLQKVEETGVHLNSELRNPIEINGMEINVQACVCLTQCPGEFENFDMIYSFFNELDDDKYTGKVLHSDDLFKKDRYDLMKDIDGILENALVERKFEVYYQPIFNIKAKKFTSAEALIRLNDEKYGFISPELFIPAAEKNGSINRIGSYVLEEVCKFIATDEFKPLGLEYIEINLSTVECMQSNLIAKVMPVLDQYAVTASQVNLEITETAVGNMQSTMNTNITDLYNSGLTFSLDDFGTGYSNMQRIASLPLSIIKIDRSLASSISDKSTRVVLENTVKMIKALNMKIVVEGVETKEMADYFEKLKCDYIQGYYYSRPVPRNEFVRFVREKNLGV
ncbi:MAG: EAL domain-containing protein [Lachnospiraceae bacterium]|nr:EAL domain-containing protein [Lachnospiraceae bacterium]